MKSWTKDRDDICQAISSVPAEMKIVLKTKNEKFLLERWISHHSEIVGSQNIIIMDNASTSPAVLNVYDNLSPEALVVSYPGHHNLLHEIEVFPELYEALRQSSRFYIFLDTDEFLYWFRSGCYLSPLGIETFLQESDPETSSPGIWLSNYPHRADTLFVNDNRERIVEGLKWGKPLISSRLALSGRINHNVELKQCIPSARVQFGLFVAHLNRFSAEQRIAQNIQKIISRGVAANAEEVYELSRRASNSDLDDNVQLYLSEIVEFTGRFPKPLPANRIPSGCLRIEPDGMLEFYR